MEEVQSGQSKKVFVLGDTSAVSEVIAGIPNVQTTKKNSEAVIAVCVWNVDQEASYRSFEAQVQTFSQKNIPIIFVAVQKLALDVQLRMKRIAELDAWRKRLEIKSSVILQLPVNCDAGSTAFRDEVERAVGAIDAMRELEQYKVQQACHKEDVIKQYGVIIEAWEKSGKTKKFSGEELEIIQEAQAIMKARNPVRSASQTIAQPASASAAQSVSVVQPTSFFVYPKDVTRSHTRQMRNLYAKNNLKIKEDDSNRAKIKKLVLLFAHYMSLRHTIFNIGHVNSAVSRSVEDELAKGLDYQDDRESDRATIRGHKYDRVAKDFKQLILNKFPAGQRQNDESFINKLIDLLACADTLERGTFDYPTKQLDINRIIQAVDTAYWNKFERQDPEAPKNVQDLPPDAQSKFNVLYNEAVGVAHRQTQTI